MRSRECDIVRPSCYSGIHNALLHPETIHIYFIISKLEIDICN
jgi:hypothetical protein